MVESIIDIIYLGTIYSELINKSEQKQGSESFRTHHTTYIRTTRTTLDILFLFCSPHTTVPIYVLYIIFSPTIQPHHSN